MAFDLVPPSPAPERSHDVAEWVRDRAKRRDFTMTNAQASADRKPTHRLYHVEGTGEKTNWTIIGAAWANKDGNGFNITCAAVPLTGRIVMRKIKPANAAEPAMI